MLLGDFLEDVVFACAVVGQVREFALRVAAIFIDDLLDRLIIEPLDQLELLGAVLIPVVEHVVRVADIFQILVLVSLDAFRPSLVPERGGGHVRNLTLPLTGHLTLAFV